jgi:hypothetical protein
MTSACGGGDGEATTGSDPAPDCKAYLSEAPLGAMVLTIKNNRATAVYIGRATCSTKFSVTAPGIASSTADLVGLSLTCDQAQKSVDLPQDCLDNSAQPIEPGATAELTWNGLIYEDVMMPESCFGPATNFKPTTCLQGKAPEAGMVEVAVSLFASASCNNDMQCFGPADGFEVKKSASYPGEAAVQIDVN